MSKAPLLVQLEIFVIIIIHAIQGYGTNFYSEDEYYEGEWYTNKRSGWGRMYYEDGSVYEGEWYGDKRNGKGLLRLANGNRYEGSWSNDMKNGGGKFYYLDKGQVYVGNWVDDIAKCGTLEDFGREGAPEPPVYPIPEVRLIITIVKSTTFCNNCMKYCRVALSLPLMYSSTLCLLLLQGWVAHMHCCI